MSQYPSGQQPQYPQGYGQQQPAQPGQPYPGYPGYPQGQYPQQYPMPYSPYQIPQVHPMDAQAQMQGPGGRFSRAGMMLIVLGALMGVCGLGCAGLAAAAPWDQVMAQAQQMDPQIQAMMSPEKARGQMIGTGVVSLVSSIVCIILGILVRRQNKVATIVGIVLASLLVLYFFLNMIGTLILGAALGPLFVLLGECVSVLAMVVVIWQLVWLVQAVRSGSALKLAQTQMQMQYWQMMAMQQQQQQYQQMMQAAAPQQQQSEFRSQNSEEGKGGGDMGQGGEPPRQEPPAGTPPTA